ncbi:Maf1 regulator-domain-containing protein [Lasiosphaeris hirsuta]|uniref:Repressor of RNA polymerase III transcription MAF1 n=1 Tax=Lasiosphaeris hirsuta TaxID=260670 RepID=A0AA40E1T4_9PEZI|nr:Maf1 regulator-domain-containing protein [Lasiosphaeris hirsuta]
MKFLSLPSFDTVTGALNFDTPDCHVAGGCDLYTTKAAGSDKKLYKNIQQELESQHAALVKFGASLSPPRRESMLNLSRSSPFGSLEVVSNRRTFAYLIATLNASHPDYDFSQLLRPTDFKRERMLRRVMTHIDSTLHSVRPNSNYLDISVQRGSPGNPITPAWGPQMWAMVDKEMTLNDCTIFSYQPQDDPFDEEEGAIWALHYFFFNKTLKRVCYIYVRGVPVMSHSPRVSPRALLSRRTALSKGSASALDEEDDEGASKRARYWLGDRFADRVTASDDEMEADDGLIWNRDADGDISCQYDDDDDSYDEEEYDPDVEPESDDEITHEQRYKNPVLGMSEDMASRMDIDI